MTPEGIPLIIPISIHCSPLLSMITVIIHDYLIRGSLSNYYNYIRCQYCYQYLYNHYSPLVTINMWANPSKSTWCLRFDAGFGAFLAGGFASSACRAGAGLRLKHPNCMVPMECRHSQQKNMVLFRGCLILGWRDYLRLIAMVPIALVYLWFIEKSEWQHDLLIKWWNG